MNCFHESAKNRKTHSSNKILTREQSHQCMKPSKGKVDKRESKNQKRGACTFNNWQIGLKVNTEDEKK